MHVWTGYQGAAAHTQRALRMQSHIMHTNHVPKPHKTRMSSTSSSDKPYKTHTKWARPLPLPLPPAIPFHIGGNGRFTCERMSPPRPVVYAAHSVAVALGATQADPGMSVNETVEGLFGSDETCGTTTVGASHVSGGGSRKWSSTSDRDDAPPTYERDTYVSEQRQSCQRTASAKAAGDVDGFACLGWE
eukprot:350229-Chlamydomonas_euryale.AAC.3